MIDKMRLTDAALRFGGTLVNPDCLFNSVSTDSRTIQQGDLFVALSGENFDAHQFLEQVADQAAGLVVNRVNKELPLTQWVVEDTVVALGNIARLQREKFQGPVIALTGSSGKTSVKEMIASILRQAGKVHATRGNLNNHIGVPLTLLVLDAEDDFSVVEMGASAAGEINYLCSIAKPDVVLINNVQAAHVDGFGSVDGIARAKGEIYQNLSKTGTAILNLDDAYSDQWRTLIGSRDCITFSLHGESVKGKEADVTATDIEAVGNGCYQFMLHCYGQKHLVQLTVPGRHSVSNALAATACAAAVKAGLTQIVAGLESVQSVAGRLQVKTLPSGARVIDDSYNANPGSVKAAIDVLAEQHGRKILVLGDMAELGNTAEQLHSEVGEYAKEAGIDELYSLGQLSREASAGFSGSQFSGKHFETLNELKEPLIQEARGSGVTLLVKGSRSARMERVVDMLLNEGQN